MPVYWEVARGKGHPISYDAATRAPASSNFAGSLGRPGDLAEAIRWIAWVSEGFPRPYARHKTPNGLTAR